MAPVPTPDIDSGRPGAQPGAPGPVAPVRPTEFVPAAGGSRIGARWKLLAILLVCAAPVIASYLAYYVIRPDGRTNYGELIEPQRSIAALQLAPLDAAGASIADFKGKWLMVSIDRGACEGTCKDKLYLMRQVRLTTGRDRERVVRMLLIDDSATPGAGVVSDYEATVFARIAPDAAAQFPTEPDTRAIDHVYIVDPLGNLMMRFPRNADPNRVKKDVAKLLRASRAG